MKGKVIEIETGDLTHDFGGYEIVTVGDRSKLGPRCGMCDVCLDVYDIGDSLICHECSMAVELWKNTGAIEINRRPT